MYNGWMYQILMLNKHLLCLINSYHVEITNYYSASVILQYYNTLCVELMLTVNQ